MFSQGVIEGFYGRSWSWQERQQMLAFLAANHFSSYCYAPKSDRHLRNDWQQSWPADDYAQLRNLSDQARDLGLAFGIGFSPLGLFEHWDAAGRQQLKARLKEISSLHPGGLAILFDDMWGDLPELAATQVEIAHFVAEHIAVDQLIVCPSYYAFDPILPELFGAMPANYWSDLGEQLAPEIDLFWTGDQVISREYTQSGLEQITALFQRKPVIWDNSIANDGRKTSPFLWLREMFSLDLLQQYSKGVLVNPMNQAALSQLVLMTLGNAASHPSFVEVLHQQVPEIASLITQHLDDFNHVGCDDLSENTRQQLVQALGNVQLPAAKNIMDWLEGRYRFDPACLT